MAKSSQKQQPYDPEDLTRAEVSINSIIKPLPEKQDNWLFGKLAESVILGLA